MKSIKGWGDWYVHPFTLLYLLMAFLADNLSNYLIALIIVCIHEYGHYYFAKKYHFEINKVTVFPFGAFLSLEDYGLHHIVEEMIMLLGGLVTHFFIFIIFKFVWYQEYVLQVNQLILAFNLLPIYPLDGSKLFLLVLSLYIDYYRAIRIQIKLSILTLAILIINYHGLGYWLVAGYLIYINYTYIKEFRYQIIRLYLQRMIKNPYQRPKINYDYRFYRPYINYYIIDGHSDSEIHVLKQLIKNLKNS